MMKHTTKYTKHLFEKVEKTCFLLVFLEIGKTPKKVEIILLLLVWKKLLKPEITTCYNRK